VSNIAIGYHAGQTIQDGNYNIVIGDSSDVVEPTGSRITLIGAQVDAVSGVTDNAIAIGYLADALANNSAVIGNKDVTDVCFGCSGHQTSGLLDIGKKYLISNYVSSDNFSNVGASFNSTGTQFTATGTTPTTWTNGSTLEAIGNASLHAKNLVGGFTAHFSRGGAAIQTNDTIITPWTCPYSGTITGYSISADSGTCTLKTWKKANGTAIPTIADVISTSGVSLSTGTHIRSSTVSDFTTTTVTAGDMFMAQVTAVSGATDITFQVEITR
jgi:hypothetical protein